MTQIDKEMREAYHQWFSSQPLPTIGVVTPQGEVGYSEEAVKWGFQAAYQLQQRRVEELEGANTESMSQTNGALSNRMAYYNERNAELNAENYKLQIHLNLAVEAFERIEIADTDYRTELDENMNVVREIAQTALNQIRGETPCSK